MTPYWSMIARTRPTDREPNQIIGSVPDEATEQPDTIIAEWLRAGLIVERVPTEWVRTRLLSTDVWEGSDASR